MAWSKEKTPIKGWEGEIRVLVPRSLFDVLIPAKQGFIRAILDRIGRREQSAKSVYSVLYSSITLGELLRHCDDILEEMGVAGRPVLSLPLPANDRVLLRMGAIKATYTRKTQ